MGWPLVIGERGGKSVMATGVRSERREGGSVPSLPWARRGGAEKQKAGHIERGGKKFQRSGSPFLWLSGVVYGVSSSLMH